MGYIPYMRPNISLYSRCQRTRPQYLRWIRNGFNQHDMSKYLNVDLRTVYQDLENFDLIKVYESRHPKAQPGKKPVPRPTLESLAESGHTADEIGKLLGGVTRSWVGQLLKSRGLLEKFHQARQRRKGEDREAKSKELAEETEKNQALLNQLVALASQKCGQDQALRYTMSYFLQSRHHPIYNAGQCCWGSVYKILRAYLEEPKPFTRGFYARLARASGSSFKTAGHVISYLGFSLPEVQGYNYLTAEEVQRVEASFSVPSQLNLRDRAYVLGVDVSVYVIRYQEFKGMKNKGKRFIYHEHGGAKFSYRAALRLYSSIDNGLPKDEAMVESGILTPGGYSFAVRNRKRIERECNKFKSQVQNALGTK